jgi:[acyl-carrier-protein] S-malonyltransferase
MSLALLFPGQGSQAVGMGRELARRYPVAARTFEEADERLGAPLSRTMWEGPAEELVLTRNAQPAILVHSVAAFRVATELAPEKIGSPAMAAGHSLGEFSAHVAAGTLSFIDALGAVRLRGELMYAAGQSREGAMAALLGLEDAEVERVCREASSPSGDQVCVPANFNTPGQVVISGDTAAVHRALEGAKAAGVKRAVLLDVSGAFHSPLMLPAEEGLRERLEGLTFHASDFPVVSNVTTRPVPDGDGARDLLVRQLTTPVRWSESIATMLDSGVDRFVELGPGAVLCGLNRRNAKGFDCVSLGEPDAMEAFST